MFSIAGELRRLAELNLAQDDESTYNLLLWTGFWGDQSGHAVIADELAIVFATMLNEAIGHVANPELLMREGVNDEIGHTLVAFGLDRGGAIGKGFLHERDHVGLGLVLIAFGIFAGWRLLAHYRIGEVVVGSCRVQQLLGEAALGGCGLHVVLVFGKVFGHSGELAADIVPC